jgi:DNA-binding CsgD family transcriptional regulator/PAS domain-containing protein
VEIMPPVPAQRRIEALIERCYAGLDAMALGREVVTRLRSVLGIDAAFVATVDPATLLFTSAASEDPLIEATPLFLANELGGRDVNRFTDLATAPIPVRTLDQATRGDRDQSARHAAIMRPLGLGDELRAALRTRQACWGVMCLHRESGPTGFSQPDRDTVAKIAPHVAEGLRRALLAGHARDPRPALGQGVVILDAAGTVTSVNDAAERWLAQIPDTDWPRSCQLPLPLLTAAAAADHDQAGGEHLAPTVRLRTTGGGWLSVHASRLHGASGQSTVLVLEEPGHGDVTSLTLDSHGVTGAQAKVVALVLRGYSTRQIVSQLAISQYTVQEHLSAVFDKLGVRSRQELAAALLRPRH